MQIVSTKGAPAAIGPYSQAVKAGEFLFCSGQIPLVPATGELAGADIATQTKQVLSNLEAVLEAGDATKINVIKATIFLKNMDDFAIVNALYADFFGDHKPARATVQVACLPKDALIEIDFVAYLGALCVCKNGFEKTINL